MYESSRRGTIVSEPEPACGTQRQQAPLAPEGPRRATRDYPDRLLDPRRPTSAEDGRLDKTAKMPFPVQGDLNRSITA
jgi:hypothetical protein